MAPPPATPWALLWLGGVAAAWAPLLLTDSLPSAPRAMAPGEPGAAAPAGVAATARARAASLASLAPPQPLLTSLGEAAAPLWVRPSPWAADEAPGSPVAVEPGVQAELEPHGAAAFAPRSRSDPLPGSLLLGGPLTLASLQEKPMVPAARLEQTLRARSADRLSAVPLHWRPTMEALIQGKHHVMPAEVVRLPAPHLKEPEVYPMAVQADGVAETPVNPSAPSRQALERWAERQSPTPQGTVRPVVVVLEPLAVEPTP